MAIIALHRLTQNQRTNTAGRLVQREHRWRLINAYTSYFLRFETAADASGLSPGALLEVDATPQGDTLLVHALQIWHVPPQGATPPTIGPATLPLGRALQARHRLNRHIRNFFEDRDFLEVETPAWTQAPGTDPHLDPVAADFFENAHPEERHRGYLHTSPELKMKRLLAAGSGPIYQLTRVWRNGEVTPLHTPEFTLLEWYRPWQDVNVIIDDVEALVCSVLDPTRPRHVASPIPRMTMQELVLAACGFDLLDALDVESLRDELATRNLLSPRALKTSRWDELFFALAVEHLDPFLAKQGALFITHWPAPLAILARRHDDDPRVAERFELYVDGVELANGFGELTDPAEQRSRFEQDNAARRALGLDALPIPEAFLNALQWGLPPSAGVALGVDRLLLLHMMDDASIISDVTPFALYRNNGAIHWP